MTCPCSRTSECRATDNERSFPLPNLEERFKRGLGVHEAPEVMNVQLAESRSMSGICRERQGG